MNDSTDRNFRPTVMGSFRYALARGMLAGLYLFENGDKILQIFLYCGNLIRSIFDRLPEIVKLDACFSQLECDRNDSQT